MRASDPATGKPIEGDETLLRQAFLNVKLITASPRARRARGCVRLAIPVADLARIAPLVMTLVF